ncbi:hypothetical protein GCM10027299_22090 [Larkinella ripae]
MENASVLYTKEQKALLYGKLKGVMPDGTLVPKIHRYGPKIREILLAKGVDYETAYIRQVLWWLTDNINVWNAVVQLIELEHSKHSTIIEKRDRVLNLV